MNSIPKTRLSWMLELDSELIFWGLIAWPFTSLRCTSRDIQKLCVRLMVPCMPLLKQIAANHSFYPLWVKRRPQLELHHLSPKLPLSPTNSVRLFSTQLMEKPSGLPHKNDSPQSCQSTTSSCIQYHYGSCVQSLDWRNFKIPLHGPRQL